MQLNSTMIREWLKRECRTHRYLSSKLHVSEVLVSKWLAGDREPKEEKMLELASLIGVSVGELLIPKAKAG